MKATMEFRTIFMFLPVLPMISLQDGDLRAPCPVFTENSVFVNATSGDDSRNCGSIESPCKTISYAVKQTLEYSSVLINISWGVYKEERSIKIDCGRSKLQRISVWGQRQGENLVQVDVSFDVQLCEMSIIDLHWKKGSPVIHKALLSDLTICQSTMDQTDVSILGSSSNIVLQDSSITNSSGYKQMLPILSLNSFPGYHTQLQIKYCNFSANNGPVIFVASLQASIINSHFKGNKEFSPGREIITSQFSHLIVSTSRFISNSGTLLGIKNSGSLNLSESLFVRNKGLNGSVIVMEGVSRSVVKDCVFQDSSSSKEGPVMRIKDNNTSASLENCNFSCNAVHSNVFLPPVLSPGVDQVTCDNCTVDRNCPVHCAPGEFLESNILCKPCPVGSYSPGVAMNKTVEKCASCPAGTYGSKEGAKTCTLCGQDTFSSKEGSTFCGECKNDCFTSGRGQASCSKLTVGFITLIVLVGLLITVPLVILLLRRPQANPEFNNYSICFQREDRSRLLGKRNKRNFSIQEGDEDSVSGLLT